MTVKEVRSLAGALFSDRKERILSFAKGVCDNILDIEFKSQLSDEYIQDVITSSDVALTPTNLELSLTIAFGIDMDDDAYMTHVSVADVIAGAKHAITIGFREDTMWFDDQDEELVSAMFKGTEGLTSKEVDVVVASNLNKLMLDGVGIALMFSIYANLDIDTNTQGMLLN